MIESLIVLGLLALLSVIGWARVLLSWESIAIAGAACSALGLVFGLPAGIYYHIVLHRSLSPRGLLPPRWWWSPVRYHRHLAESERARVLKWFYAGGVGFALIVLGGGVTLVGILLAR